MENINIADLNQDKDITRAIWKIAWPVMLGMIVQTFLGIVDVFFVNKLGVDHSAAIVVSDSIFGVIFVLSSLISVGSLSIISREAGRRNPELLKRFSAQSVLYTVIIALFITIISIACLNQLFNIFGLSLSVSLLAKQYLIIRLIGLVFIYLNETLRSLMHGLGNSYGPMKILILSNIINIFLTPLLIFGYFIIPGFGITGAAVSTVIASCIGTILLFYKYLDLYKIANIRNFLGFISFKLLYLKSILNIGIFASISNITRPFTGMIMFKIAAVHSTSAVAAFGNGGRLLGLIFIILQGLQVACSVLVGQSFGSNDYSSLNKVVRSALKISLYNVLFFGILFFVFPDKLLWIFIQDMEVIAIGVNYLRIVYVGVIFCAFTVIFGGYFIGIGNTKPPMFASLIGNYAVKLPVALIFIVYLDMSLNWLWYAISFSIVAEALVLYSFYKKKDCFDLINSSNDEKIACYH